MPRKHLTPRAAPAAITELSRQLGANVAFARKRRRITQASLATRAGISRPTLARIEAGEIGVGLDVFLAVLWALGLEGQVRQVASPADDREGVTLEAARLGHRVRATHQLTDDF